MTLNRLQALAAPTAMVRRDEKWAEIAAAELVPGDLIALKGGDVIPADARVCFKQQPIWTNNHTILFRHQILFLLFTQ